MSFPQFKKKYLHAPLFSPKEFLQYQKTRGKYPLFSVPKAVIFTYNSPFLTRHIKSKYNAKKVSGFHGNLLYLPKQKILVVENTGIGAPNVTTTMEELIAFGVKRFWSIGRAGCLQDIPFETVIVCRKAIRDEGASHHYLARSRFSHATQSMIQKAKKALIAEKVPFVIGTSWTIDTPYRETKKEVEHYRKEGVLTVEMEAAAIFAVAKVRKVQAGALFTISDHLGETEWTPKFKDSRKNLKKLFDLTFKIAQR